YLIAGDRHGVVIEREGDLAHSGRAQREAITLLARPHVQETDRPPRTDRQRLAVGRKSQAMYHVIFLLGAEQFLAGPHVPANDAPMRASTRETLAVGRIGHAPAIRRLIVARRDAKFS